MYSRQEFADYWNNEKNGLGNNNSPLWEAECMLLVKCEYFILTMVDNRQEHIYGTFGKQKFWEWCGDNLQGDTRCFSSGECGDNSSSYSEWWGFTHKADIVLFMLRWC
mgnify:CR=1 FL=1